MKDIIDIKQFEVRPDGRELLLDIESKDRHNRIPETFTFCVQSSENNTIIEVCKLKTLVDYMNTLYHNHNNHKEHHNIYGHEKDYIEHFNNNSVYGKDNMSGYHHSNIREGSEDIANYYREEFGLKPNETFEEHNHHIWHNIHHHSNCVPMKPSPFPHCHYPLHLYGPITMFNEMNPIFRHGYKNGISQDMLDNMYNKGIIKHKVNLGKDLLMIMFEDDVIKYTFMFSPFLTEVMAYVKQTASECCLPKEFIDSILRWMGFSTAMKAHQYETAIKWYKAFIVRDLAGYKFNKCACGK